MKKGILFLLLIFSSTIALSQKNRLQKTIAKKYLNVIGIDKKIDSYLQTEKEKILSNKKALFDAKNLDANIAEDISYFTTNIEVHFNFIKKSIMNQLIFKYANRNQKRLKIIIKSIKNKKAASDFMEIKQANKTLKLLLDKEMDELHKNIIPELLQNIVKKQSGIPLTIKLNNKNISPTNIDIKINAVLADNNTIPLLNNQSATIKKPLDSTYKNFKSIIISYKNQDFVFAPDEKIKVLPKKLADLKNPISKYSFEEIDYWVIYIDETEKSTVITLSSTEEFTVEKPKK